MQKALDYDVSPTTDTIEATVVSVIHTLAHH